MYSLKKSLQNFLSILEMCFICLSTWMSDTSHFNQTVGDKMQQGTKVLEWQKSGSNITSDWKDRLILIRQNVSGDRGEISAPGINSPVAHRQGILSSERTVLPFIFSLVFRIIVSLVALGLSCSIQNFYLRHAGSNQGPLHCESGVLATGPPRKSLQAFRLKLSVSCVKKLHSASLSLTLGMD